MHERPVMRPNEIYSNTQLRVHFGIYICAPACNSGSISRLLPRYRISKLKSRHTSPRSQIGFDGSQKPSAPFLVPRNCYRRPPGRGLDKRSSAVAISHEACPNPICYKIPKAQEYSKDALAPALNEKQLLAGLSAQPDWQADNSLEIVH